jgi:phosphorylcholine metabolism protein LicD
MTRVATHPCTRSTARCADARHYDTELAQCCRSHIREIMAAVVEFFTLRKIVFWADYGTLMGAVCNPLTTWADYPWLPQDDRPDGPLAPGIIPHDKDGDLGVEFKAWPMARQHMQRFLTMRRLHLHTNNGRASMKARLSKSNHTNVDMFFWRTVSPLERRARYPVGTMYRDRYAGVDTYKGREFHKDLLFPLSKVEWEGMTLPAPHDPEKFLEFRYGKGWRTPVMANHKGVKR